MGFINTIKNVLPQDKVTRIFSGFVGIMLVGIIGSVVVISIPDVRTELSKRIGYGPLSKASLQLGVYQPPAFNDEIGFRVSKDPNQDSLNDSTTKIYAQTGDTVYLYWDADESFSPTKPPNIDANGKTKADVYPGKTEGQWIGCGPSPLDKVATINQKFKKGESENGKDVQWSGYKDASGNLVKHWWESNVTTGKTVNSEESIKNPNGGFGVKITTEMKIVNSPPANESFNLYCVRYKSKESLSVERIYVKVAIFISKDGEEPPKPESISQEKIDIINDSYSADQPGHPLYQEVTNMKASANCQKVTSYVDTYGVSFERPSVRFSWSSSTKSMLPDDTKFQIVVSNDRYFGAFNSYYNVTKGGSGTGQYNISGSGSHFAGAETSSKGIGWSLWSPFYGDAKPMLTNTKANNINDVGGVGTQSTPASGHYFWKVLTYTSNGESDWVEGPSFNVNCDYNPPKAANITIQAKDPGVFTPKKPVAKPFSVENYPLGSITATSLSCDTDNPSINFQWGSPVPKTPKGYSNGYVLQVSTDKDFSSYGTPFISNTGLTQWKWIGGHQGTGGMKGDVDPSVDGDINRPEKGKTYYYRYSYVLKKYAGTGPSEFKWDFVEGNSITLCEEEEPSGGTGTDQPDFPDEDEINESLGEGGAITEEEIILIRNHIDFFRAIIEYFGLK